MNYRSRYSHQLKTKSTKFLLDEHGETYDALCDRLKKAKELMDKLELKPHVRPHHEQSMRFVNMGDE